MRNAPTLRWLNEGWGGHSCVSAAPGGASAAWLKRHLPRSARWALRNCPAFAVNAVAPGCAVLLPAKAALRGLREPSRSWSTQCAHPLTRRRRRTTANGARSRSSRPGTAARPVTEARPDSGAAASMTGTTGTCIRTYDEFIGERDLYMARRDLSPLSPRVAPVRLKVSAISKARFPKFAGKAATSRARKAELVFSTNGRSRQKCWYVRLACES